MTAFLIISIGSIQQLSKEIVDNVALDVAVAKHQVRSIETGKENIKKIEYNENKFLVWLVEPSLLPRTLSDLWSGPN